MLLGKRRHSKYTSSFRNGARRDGSEAKTGSYFVQGPNPKLHKSLNSGALRLNTVHLNRFVDTITILKNSLEQSLESLECWVKRRAHCTLRNGRAH